MMRSLLGWWPGPNGGGAAAPKSSNPPGDPQLFWVSSIYSTVFVVFDSIYQYLLNLTVLVQQYLLAVC